MEFGLPLGTRAPWLRVPGLIPSPMRSSPPRSGACSSNPRCLSFTCAACRQTLEYQEEVVAAPLEDGTRRPFLRRSGDEVENDLAEPAYHVRCYREMHRADRAAYPMPDGYPAS